METMMDDTYGEQSYNALDRDDYEAIKAVWEQERKELRRERDEAVRVIKALLLTLPEETFEDAMDDMPRWIVDAMMAASKPENADGRQ
jgi:hypothetical protein